MPGAYIDTLALAPGQKPFFTADNTQAFVTAERSAVERPKLSLNGLGARAQFQRGDSVLILAAGVRLPYVYSIATNPIVMDLAWIQVAEGTLSEIGKILIPVEGQDYSLKGSNADGIFIRNGSIAIPGVDGPWYLTARLNVDFAAATINQFYAPDVLNGSDLEIDFWVKVQHTLALEGDA